MASRIPQPVPKPSATTISTQRHPLAKDLRSIQASLHSLHSPSLTVKDLSRLSDGPFGDVLAFICEHVKGRKGIADARNKIHASNQRQNRAKIPGVPGGRGEPAVARSSTDRAYSRLASAKKNMKVYEEQLSERQAAISSSHDGVDGLQQTLDGKLRVGMLLGVLREREDVRVRRFAEITRLLRVARKSISESRPATSSPSPTEEPSPSHQPHSSSRRNHTGDTLANLHVHHARLSSLASRSYDAPSALEVRLRKSIARQMNCSETDKRVVLALNKCLAMAQVRAAQKVEYRNAFSTSPSKAELEKLMQTNKEKEQELQRASDKSIALQFLCDHFIKSISVFLQNTSTLRTHLEEETRQAKGYVDVLQELIASSSSKRESKKTFVHSVQEACGVMDVPLRGILEHVDEIMHRVNRREAFLARSQIHPSPFPSIDDITEHQTKQRALDGELAVALRRKLDEAEMSDKLVEDIGVLVKETSMLART